MRESYLPELVAALGEKSAFALRFAGYPDYIKEAIESALTVFCVKHEVSEPSEIEHLSELVDDVAFCIEMGLIDNKKKEIINKKHG